IGRAIIATAKAAGVPVAFWLRNCLYSEADFFDAIDLILVPSDFTAHFYRQRLGISCAPIPSPVNELRIRCETLAPLHATFVNPPRAKGALFFLGIARVLAQVRPENSLLVVEGRAGPQWWRHP